MAITNSSPRDLVPRRQPLCPRPSPLDPRPCPASAPSRSVAKSTNTKPNSFARGCIGIGFRDAARGEAADLCIVNTCTVTHEGDSKSRQTIRQLAARNPGTRIVVMGCYATRRPKKSPRFPAWPKSSPTSANCPTCSAASASSICPPASAPSPTANGRMSKCKTAACCNCSFCIIPKVRPHFASRPVEHILDEVGRLVDSRLSRIDSHWHPSGPLWRGMEPRAAEVASGSGLPI